MRIRGKYVLGTCVGMVLPFLLQAQDMTSTGISGGIAGLQVTLEQVYEAMIVNCAALQQVGQALAGFGALFFIAYRVWGSIAWAEPIDVYPLLRPFATGIAIAFFPAVIGLMNGFLAPTVAGTSALVTNANQAVATLLQQREQAAENATDWQSLIAPPMDANAEQRQEIYGEEATPSTAEGITPGAKLQMSGSSWGLASLIRKWLSELLEVLFEAAALCINTVRTFYLIILAILGPLVFGLSVFNGLHHLLSAWIARYINIFLWLRIANIFGSIIAEVQQQMLQVDIAQLQSTGQTSFGSTDTAYLIFLIMGIVGYFTVPSVAGWVINVGGHGGHLSKVTAAGAYVGSKAMSYVKQAGGMAVNGLVNLAGAPGNIMEGYKQGGKGGEAGNNQAKSAKISGTTKTP